MSFFSESSIVLTPNAYKAAKVYSIKPTSGVGDFAFSRASTATRVNESGAIESMGVNVPRMDYTDASCPSLLLEPSSINIYLNSAVLVNQGVTTTATSYTVSFYGTGSITFSGSYSGSLVGSGLTDRVSKTFTAASGTLTSTVSGTVTDGQCEAKTYATSYIPTSGTAVTRSADNCSGSGDVNTFNSPEGVLYAELAALVDDGTSRDISVSDGTSSNYARISLSNAVGNIEYNIVVGGSTQASGVSTMTQTNFNKIAVKWKVNDFSLWLNGTEVLTDSIGSTFPASTLTTLNFNRGSGANPMYGKFKGVQVYTSALSDADLTTLTTL